MSAVNNNRIFGKFFSINELKFYDITVEVGRVLGFINAQNKAEDILLNTNWFNDVEHQDYLDTANIYNISDWILSFEDNNEEV